MKATARALKDHVYAQHARVGKALASPKRIELLERLAQGPLPVEALAEATATTIANASQHLQVLRGARLVEVEKRGTWAYYRLADPAVSDFLVAFRRLGEARLAEIAEVTRRFWEERGALEEVDGEALVARVRAGEVTLLDVRTPEEFAAGHLPGALSVPAETLEARLAALPRDRDVVAYCRGPYCVLAEGAVARLREAGFRAHRLAEGVPDWRARGLPVEAR